MMADLFHFFLSGEKAQEYTLATTSQLLHPGTGQWAKPIFDKLSLPIKIMPQVTLSGTVIGSLREKVAEESGLGRVPVIAGASHDYILEETPVGNVLAMFETIRDFG